MAQPEKRHRPFAPGIREWLRRFMSQAVSTPALATMIVILYLTAVGGYMLYRHANPAFEGILERAAAVEAINPATETEHQTLRLEETSANGSTIPRGTIELWQDGNGKRFSRRLYDNQNRLLAFESPSQSGQRFTTVAQPQAALSASDERLIEDGLWKRDISAVTFQLAAGKKAHVTSTNTGFEITVANDVPGNAGILSQTLVLNRSYQLVEERLQVRRGATIEQVRFVQTVYRKERSASVPDSTFQSGQPSSLSAPEAPSHLMQKHSDNSLLPGESFATLSRLHIAVLFALNQLNADVADPIAVVRTSDGYIRVTGLIANEQRLAQVKAALAALPDNYLIEDQLTSSAVAEARVPHATYPSRVPNHIEETQIGEPAATEALRRHFQIAGASGASLDADIANFTHDALQHAQRALQSSYALDRLGSVLGQAAPGSLDVLSQQRWAEMVAKHTAAVQTNLQALKSQLEVISISPPETGDAEGNLVAIDNPVEFMSAASKLRKSVQAINVQAGEIFAGAAESNPSSLQQMLSATIRSLPVKSASQLGSFAANLSNTKHLAEIAPDRKYSQRQ